MKYAWIIGLICTFPIAVWIFTYGRSNQVSPKVLNHQDSSLDLKAAAELTMKKITEMDIKILATRGELMKHERERERMTRDLIEIHAKIDDLLQGTGRVHQ